MLRVMFYVLILGWIPSFDAIGMTYYACKKGGEIVYQQLPCPVNWHTAIEQTEAPIIESRPIKKSTERKSKTAPLIIKRDPDSHFRIKGSINGVELTFLIDTGATQVTVSDVFAKRAKLEAGEKIQANTAGGTVSGYVAHTKELKIGSYILKKISVGVMSTMKEDEALLGMNVLERFDIEQKNDELTLTLRPD